MFLFCKEKKFYALVVLVITMSQIAEVSGWDWLNYWSYRLCRWLPWYTRMPWAIQRAEALTYEAYRMRYYKKYPPRWRVTVPPSPITLREEASLFPPRQPLEDVDEAGDPTPSTLPRPAPGTARRFGRFPLDPDQQLDEETFTF